MIFWRIVDNKVLPVGEVETLGFEEGDGMRIPDEYLEEQEFVIMRGCHGIGDYGIISAMPRLLKEKYPNCGVFVPSNNLYQKLWGKDNKVVESIFKNNPYVDGFCDEVKGDIFHDHYRVWNKNKSESLVKQVSKLKNINYFKGLGTYYDKVQRIRKLSGLISDDLLISKEKIEIASIICKVDLLSDLVGEFPELQGVL